MTNVFFDTNVLLYLLSKERAKADRAERLLLKRGTVSVQVLNEFAAVAARKFGMAWSEIGEVLTTIRAVCATVPLTVATHEQGIAIAERYRLNIYDALIVAAAVQTGCVVLYSEDMQAGQTFAGTTIRNPFAEA